LLFAGVGACLGPTEITLDVTTNVDCATGLHEVDIYIGKHGEALTSPSAVASKCEDPTNDRVGTLVVIPSSIDETVDISVVAVLTGAAACPPDSTDSHCIVAKRSLGYISHTPLELPIFLDANCAGFTCPDGQTCAAPNGKPMCVDDTPTCSASGGSATSCGLDGGASDATTIADADVRPDGATSDGGATDAIANDVIASDAPLACTSPAAGLFTTPTYAWSFESTLADDGNQLGQQTPQTGTTFHFNGVPSCGDYVSTMLVQPLTAQQSVFASNHFAISAWIEGPASLNTTATVFTLGNTQTGLSLQFKGGVLTGTWYYGTGSVVATDSVTQPLDTWFPATLEVDASKTSGTVTLYRANVLAKATASTFTSYAPASGPLSVGATVGVDQLEFYTLP
jgi:hypothetical protein